MAVRNRKDVLCSVHFNDRRTFQALHIFHVRIVASAPRRAVLWRLHGPAHNDGESRMTTNGHKWPSLEMMHFWWAHQIGSTFTRPATAARPRDQLTAGFLIPSSDKHCWRWNRGKNVGQRQGSFRCCLQPSSAEMFVTCTWFSFSEAVASYSMRSYLLSFSFFEEEW